MEKDLEGTYVGTVASQSECNFEQRNKTTVASNLPDSEVCDGHESDYDQDGNNNGHLSAKIYVALLKSNSRVLATTVKRLPVHQIADKEYLKNANRMMVKYNLKHKVKEFHAGDCVTVRIPRIDRASTDSNRLPCIIVQVIGTARAMYCLRCKSGVLNKCYNSACDLELFEGNYNLSVKGYGKCLLMCHFEQLLKKAQQAAAHNSACTCKKNKI